MSLERHWQNMTPLSAALYPLSLVYRAITAARRAAYRRGFLTTHRVGVPVIVVGNITVGGTGKTPLALWLAAFLVSHGKRPGIVSRGYGGSATRPLEVATNADPAVVGDEPLLLARRSGCPVWIARDRVGAARALLGAHPDCDVIIADDGLQHYRLARDCEIAVVDGERRFGNGLMLPAGPLREPARRLRTVDAVVINAGTTRATARAGRNGYAMTLTGSRFRNLLDHSVEVGPGHFEGKRVHAIAGIGHPPRFFAHLKALGVTFSPHAFPDHHAYAASDLAFPDAEAILMTEKDAVKCAAFAAPNHWVLAVDAEPDEALGALVLRKLKITP
jgi:tetraacyldisaccharide 4'-kinase